MDTFIIRTGSISPNTIVMCINEPLNKDTSIIKTVLLGPKVSRIDRFDCIVIQSIWLHIIIVKKHEMNNNCFT